MADPLDVPGELPLGSAGFSSVVGFLVRGNLLGFAGEVERPVSSGFGGVLERLGVVGGVGFVCLAAAVLERVERVERVERSETFDLSESLERPDLSDLSDLVDKMACSEALGLTDVFGWPGAFDLVDLFEDIERLKAFDLADVVKRCERSDLFEASDFLDWSEPLPWVASFDCSIISLVTRSSWSVARSCSSWS